MDDVKITMTKRQGLEQILRFAQIITLPLLFLLANQTIYKFTLRCLYSFFSFFLSFECLLFFLANCPFSNFCQLCLYIIIAMN